MQLHVGAIHYQHIGRKLSPYALLPSCEATAILFNLDYVAPYLPERWAIQFL